MYFTACFTYEKNKEKGYYSWKMHFLNNRSLKMKIIDLTHTFEDDISLFPGDENLL